MPDGGPQGNHNLCRWVVQAWYASDALSSRSRHRPRACEIIFVRVLVIVIIANRPMRKPIDDGTPFAEALFRLFVGAFEAAEKSRKENDTFARFEKVWH